MMGLINKKKNDEQKKSESANLTQSEFERDILELMSRDDIQCRSEICDAEYAKAQDLLDQPTQDKVHRAYDIMGNLASQFDYLPAIMWMGDFVETVMKNLQQAAFWYKKAADLGDGNGARNYADMLMTGNGVARDQQLAIHYYSYAADKGVPEAAFVLGEFLRNNGDLENALKAYQKSLDGGYSAARFRIDQLKKGQQ